MLNNLEFDVVGQSKSYPDVVDTTLDARGWNQPSTWH